MVRLAVVRGPDPGREIELDHRQTCLGRQEGCEIQLLDSSISRRHAMIEQRDGIWILQDLDSQNGSYLDNQPVSQAEIAHGDRIRLGNVELQFLTEQPTPSAETGKAPKPALTDDHAEPATATRQNKREGRSKFQQPPASHKSAATGKSRTEAPSELALADQENIDRIRRMGAIYPRIEEQFKSVIVGQKKILEQIMIAVAANGHCLMIGLPGLAKTLMVSTLAQILQLDFKRIQFTPDLMPSDILGTEVLDVNEVTGEKSFRFIRGPVFTNVLLADEINRTPPKTQAALLESMQERQVTVANHSFPLPAPFFVLATQNPLEQEGTYPLPEAQLDRFMFNISVDYPKQSEEEEIVARTTVTASARPIPILGAEETLELQAAVRSLPVSKHVIKYATILTRATRPATDKGLPFINDHVFCGAGPRAAQNLILGAKARAVVNGRVNVSCEDVRSLALPVLRHRIFTNFTADSEGITADDLIRRVIASVPEPRAETYFARKK